jgi:hypothetical protein
VLPKARRGTTAALDVSRFFLVPFAMTDSKAKHPYLKMVFRSRVLAGERFSRAAPPGCPLEQGRRKGRGSWDRNHKQPGVFADGNLDH